MQIIQSSRVVTISCLARTPKTDHLPPPLVKSYTSIILK